MKLRCKNIRGYGNSRLSRQIDIVIKIEVLLRREMYKSLQVIDQIRQTITNISRMEIVLIFKVNMKRLKYLIKAIQTPAIIVIAPFNKETVRHSLRYSFQFGSSITTY